jgi:N-acyl-D-amino-acid deacylase
VSVRVWPSFDVLITGGRVVDGTGNPWFRADVGITGDRITAVGPLAAADSSLRLDAGGKVVAPGLIDSHVHGDLALFTDPHHEPAVRQGVTTYVLGQDGVAMAPASPATLEYMCRYTAGFSGGADWLARRREEGPSWSSMAEYLACFDRRCAINVACLVPNGNVRMEAMGLATRAPTPDELTHMKRLVREAMEQGAVGLSSGLDYIPSRYAEVEELAELCREVAPFGGAYVTHMRRYDPEGVLGAMDEVFRIGEAGGVPVHVSHFNSRAELVVPKLDAARAAGVDVTFDLYCYTAGSSILAMVALPPWVQEGGPGPTLERLRDPSVRDRLREWFANPRVPLEPVRLSYVAAEAFRHREGQTLQQAAEETDGDIGTFVCEVLLASELAVGCIAPHNQRTEEDVRALMRHPAMMGGSDGIFTGGRPHPRGCGCYARYLGHHVREGTWALETAVQRLAAHPARRFRLHDRGLLRPGMAADVIVFDPETIADRSTFEDGRRLAVGMEHVLVNGEVVLQSGRRTKALPGRGLKRG